MGTKNGWNIIALGKIDCAALHSPHFLLSFFLSAFASDLSQTGTVPWAVNVSETEEYAQGSRRYTQPARFHPIIWFLLVLLVIEVISHFDSYFLPLFSFRFTFHVFKWENCNINWNQTVFIKWNYKSEWKNSPNHMCSQFVLVPCTRRAEFMCVWVCMSAVCTACICIPRCCCGWFSALLLSIQLSFFVDDRAKDTSY